MAFRIVFFGWLAGLHAAVAAHLAMEATVMSSLAVWSAAGTAAFLFAAWSAARDGEGDEGPQRGQARAVA
jgi:hypothetical protein